MPDLMGPQNFDSPLSCRVLRCVVDLLAVPRSHIRTASHLQRTSIAVEFGGAVAEHIAVVHGAGGRFIKLPGGTVVAWPLPARSNG
jgi:hypothetical protein